MIAFSVGLIGGLLALFAFACCKASGEASMVEEQLL